MHNIEIFHKNKLLSQFHINACSLNNNFDHLQHMLNCTKKYEIIAISETRTTKQEYLLNNLNLKGPVCYIFASLVFKSKIEFF